MRKAEAQDIYATRSAYEIWGTESAAYDEVTNDLKFSVGKIQAEADNKVFGTPIPPEYSDDPLTREWARNAWRREVREEHRREKERWHARVNWLKELVAELRAAFPWRRTGND